MYIDNIKSNLSIGQFLVQLDFEENHTIDLQDSSQGKHWSKTQVTIHPFVAYYRTSKGELKHISYAIISDIKEHNTITVHLLKKTINFPTCKVKG